MALFMFQIILAFYMLTIIEITIFFGLKKINLHSFQIKLYSNKIIVSDVNNNLIFFDKINGKEIKQIPTESVTIRNEFINNIALNKENIYFFKYIRNYILLIKKKII